MDGEELINVMFEIFIKDLDEDGKHFYFITHKRCVWHKSIFVLRIPSISLFEISFKLYSNDLLSGMGREFTMENSESVPAAAEYDGGMEFLASTYSIHRRGQDSGFQEGV